MSDYQLSNVRVGIVGSYKKPLFSYVSYTQGHMMITLVDLLYCNEVSGYCMSQR